MSTPEPEDLIGVSMCGQETLSQVGHQIFRESCTTPVIKEGGRCTKHGGLELVKQKKAEVESIVLIQRAKLEAEVLPKATERIIRILNDEDSKDADIVNIWKTVMDRIGLAAVTGVLVEGNITVDAPLDILRRMLQGNVLDGEVVEDDITLPDSP